MKLKVDLHLHTANDLVELVAGRKNLIPPKQLIDLAVEQQFDAIAITHHGLQYHDPALWDYARQKGLLLIDGVETYIHKKHVLLINFKAKKHILTYADLLRYKHDDVLVIAPHPFYLLPECLGTDLIRYYHCFDAIEFCHFYYRWFNPNRKALRVARELHLPVVGNSDAHRPFQFGRTYSYVYAEEKTIPAIIRAIKEGKVEYVSQPLKLSEFLYELGWLVESLPYVVNIFLRKLALRTSQPLLMRKFATPRFSNEALDKNTARRVLGSAKTKGMPVVPDNIKTRSIDKMN